MTTRDVTEAHALRPPQDTVPKTRRHRDRLRHLTRHYTAQHALTPPLSIPELTRHASAIYESANIEGNYLDFISILLSNAVWHDRVMATPYDKRLLLIPKCLRDHEHCPAPFDDVGLLCEHCGCCLIDNFKRQAEGLGYAVLVAEGSPVVMSLIETGQIEAIVGVSCMATLERVYPYMEAGSVPGIAIPLLYDGCINTRIDTDWLWDVLYETNETSARRLDLESLRRTVDTWFTPNALAALIGTQDSHPVQLACDWMAKAGKRWRPFLTVSTYETLTETSTTPVTLQQVAVAVECFHKASLIHDDIEDDDSLRYGSKTLHMEHGIPIALNVGDTLLGEGYRLLTETDVSPLVQARLLQIAARGHRTLCLGQGAELAWTRDPRPLSVDEVIAIFRQKTAPAFEVALALGAVLAECDPSLETLLSHYSDALGIAYQVRDDLEDLLQNAQTQERLLKRPSILMAIAFEQAQADDKTLLGHIWCHPDTTASPRETVTILKKLRIDHQAARLMETYKARAIACLAPLQNPELKGLLRRVISKIFLDFDIMGCCDDGQSGRQSQ